MPANNENGHVWRYMDFTKFVDLVLSRQLYFSSLKDLRKNGDPFEGTFPEKWESKGFYGNNYGTEEEKRAQIERIREITGAYLVNCWHENDFESAAMWRLYLQSNEGIAIRSTKGKLRRILYEAIPKIEMWDVFYVDYQSGIPFDPHNLLNWATHKRKSFEHEREVRGIYYNNPFDKKPFLKVSVNPNDLIDLVAVSPTAPLWFHALVENFVRRNGLPDVQVNQSALAEVP